MGNGRWRGGGGGSAEHSKLMMPFRVNTDPIPEEIANDTTINCLKRAGLVRKDRSLGQFIKWYGKISVCVKFWEI
jgi:hypothetical protein